MRIFVRIEESASLLSSNPEGVEFPGTNTSVVSDTIVLKLSESAVRYNGINREELIFL